MKIFEKRLVSFLMALALIVGLLPPVSLKAKAETTGLEGKAISILGDSISTYQNYSNGTAAGTTNSTITNGAIYYPRSGFDVTVDSTWWYQAAQELGLDVLVNNSWSGSCLLNTRSGTVGAYVDRCVQLHDDTGDNAGQEPDIIAIFLGTNDYYTYPSTLGSYENIAFDTLIIQTETGYTYAEPATSMEAYAIILHKIAQRYPEAEVYCFTLLPRVNSTSQPTAVNEDIRQLANHFGAITVDLHNCGIQPDSTHMGDNLHPNSAGMDAMTNAFVSAVLKNSKYAPDQTLYDVTFALDKVVAMEGTDRTVVAGGALTVTLACTSDPSRLIVTVKMGGVDVTAQCYADGVVQIPAVSGNVEITASLKDRDPESFRWEYDAQKNALVSVSTGGYAENKLTMVSGSITDGKFSKVKYTLDEAVILKHDKPWVIEWKSSGTWTDTTDGALLFAGAETSTTADTPYLYRRHNSDFIAFGVSTGGQYHNYGVALSANGIDGTVDHTYKLENRINADGSNMVYLYVDDQEIGPMNHHWVGGTDKKETVDWLNGQDLVFTHMGTSPHTIGNCRMDYVQVWEDGEVPAEPQWNPQNFRWEYDAQKDALVSGSANGNTENALTMTSGSITDGKFSKVKYTLDEAVILKHNKPWVIEWKSSGTWTDTTDGALLFAGAETSTTADTPYLYRRHNSDFIAFGVSTGGQYHNYGVKLGANGIDGTIDHTYKLENRINADGSNMVYLYVDDQEIGPMNHHWVGGTDKKETVDWLNGQDLVFTHMGTSPHTIGNCYIDYIQVWENGAKHVHAYTPTVIAPTCTEQGYTTYTCQCGDSYVDDYVDADGHDFTDWYMTREATYEQAGEESRDCKKCSHVEFRTVEVAVVTSGNVGYGTPYTNAVTYTLYADGTMVIAGSGTVYCSDWRGNNQPYYAYRDQVKNLIIEEGITQTSGGCFAYFVNLERVSFPDSLIKINKNAFMNSFVSSMTSITIPATVTYLADYAFGFYSGAASATFTDVIIENPNASFHASNAVFNSGKKLQNLTLYSYGTENNVRTYAETYGCRYIDLNNYLEGEFGDVHYELSNGVLVLEPLTENAAILAENQPWASMVDKITKIVISDGVTTIADNAFADYTALTEVELPHGLEVIGDGVFTVSQSNDTSLTMALPRRLTAVGEDLFAGRSNVSLTVYYGSLGADITESGVTLDIQKVFKILLIGNSFSEDASNAGMPNSQMLDILQAMLGEDAKITVGLCYSGGKGLNWHATQSEQGNSSYSLRVISTESGAWKNYGSYTSAKALTWTDWDVVSLQHYEINTTTGKESNAYSDQVDPKFDNLESATEFMLDYVDAYAPDATVYFYMHWSRAYKANLNESLAEYNKMAAFFPVVMDYAGPESNRTFEGIIPVGLAVQNARTTYLAMLSYNSEKGITVNMQNDPQIGLQRDGGHMTYNVGRYIAALTFAETIIPEDMRAESYVLPEIRVTESVGKLPTQYSIIAQKSVLAAVNSWKNGSLAVTNIEGYTKDPTVAASETLKKLPLELKCADAEALAEQIREAVRAALDADFAVDTVTVDTPAQTASVTIRFGYTSVVVEMGYTLSAHSYENGACTGCGQKEPVVLHSYRWEIENNAMVSVTTDGNTVNDLTLTSGSITGGALKNIRYSLNKAVNLYHDVPWVIEWRSSGNWDGMLLASNADTSVNGTTYLFRFASMNFLALGDHTNTWNNYGLIHEIDMSVPHLFRLENRIGADGTNTVYLLVDGVEIDAMHHYYNSGTNQNQIVNWANGRDIVFGNIGTSSHPVNNMQLEYLQIWEKGHDHDYRSAVTAPTCTEEGYTTYTCDCGSSYVGDYVDAAGHSYENGSCKVCGAVASNPFAGKTIACIGDSITAAYGVTKDKTDYVKLLADRLEMNYIRLGASGTTLSANGGRVCNIDKLTESKLQGADVVTIAMGINDFCGAGAGYYKLGDINSTDNSTIYGAVRMWCEQIVELRETDSLKDTQFYFVTPLITSWNNSVTSARNWDQSKVNIHGYTLRDLCNAIIEVAALYDVAVIDMNLISGLYYVSAEDNNIDVFGGDGVHPGDEGHAMMAAALEDALLERYLLDDHEHSYGSWITTTYPDCEGGEEKRVCGICRATESRTLAGKGHSYENGVCVSCGEKLETMAMRYDDHVDMSGKVVEIVDAGKPTSYQVGYGVAENTVLDTAVMTVKGDSLVATGIGTAKVRIDGQLYEVTVTAAPISLLLLIGQSNMRGSEGDANQSIVCPDGMVYATFGDDRGDAEGIMNVNNATNFAASALTGEYSTINVNGNTENLSYYPINSLTEAGKGTFGPDSGFAYEWVKQTGEKVWVVNAAHGGSAISSWQPNATNFKEAVLLFSACQETLQKEIAAGHFTLSHMGYFWCQGCNDAVMTAEQYVTKYLAMHEGLKSTLAFDHDGDATTNAVGFEFAGIIPILYGVNSYRAGEYKDTNAYTYYQSFEQLTFNGPRVAQYWMCNNPELEDIWMVCNIGEDWVWMPDGTNGVSAYFQSHYENGTVDYTTQVQQSAAWYTPTTPKEVHDSIHYNQIGYNEIGRESVRNALIMLGEMEAPEVETTVELLSWDGYTTVSEVSASLTGNSGTLVVPKIYPLWKTKEVSYTLSEGLKWVYYDLLATDESVGGTLTMAGKTVTVNGHKWSEWVTVREPSAEGAGLKQRTCSHCDQVQTEEIQGVWQIYDLSAHLLELPENVCCDTNLWTILPHEDVHFTSGKKWGKINIAVPSITIPVNEGDKLFATSWQKAGVNGHETSNGIRVTFFDNMGVAKTMGPGETDKVFYANGGYLVAPEGTIAINIAMWYESEDYEVYILNREHCYENGICAGCGAEYPELADYAGKVISIMGDSISTFAGYIPVADGFNMEHLARYPQDNLLTDVNETWWMQVVAELDAKLGINDSWRGATLSGGAPVTTGTTGENAAMSNLTRIQNLGSNGTPDVILLYGGTNDLAHVSKVGTFDPETAPTEVDLTTKKWDNLADGFVHTLLRMRHYYPDAVIVAMLPTYTASYYSDEKLAQGNAVMAAICEHYGIAYVDLRDSGVTAQHLPDGIHPGEEGMDLITAAVIDALLKQCDVQPGENVVYPVRHELESVKASLGHWKGVSAGKAFMETLTGDDLSVTVTMDGADITEEVYADGVISIEEVSGALVITAKGVFTADGHLQQLPEKAYNTTNLWDVLEHDEMYYAADGWAVHSSGNVKSVTVPVTAGDRIWAASFGAAGSNGTSMNGIRVTYFTQEGLLKTMSPDEVYQEFSKNGYLTVPKGAVAVNVPMWQEKGAQMYILTLPAIPTEENVHLSQKAKLQPDGSFTFTLEIYASEKVALYEDAMIRYVLSQGFALTDESEVKAVRVSELLSDAVLYEVTAEATELTVTVDGGVLDVTGYDLSKSYIAQDHTGNKLVITISHVEATDDVIWGENMDISTADSGIWADGAMAVAFTRGSAFFRESVYVMDYAEEITLDGENIIHLDADGMGGFTNANVRLKMTYGTAQIENGSAVYIPDTMQWNGYDRFYAFAGQNEDYQWAKMAVIPANNVYYEDTCIAISAEEAAQGTGIYYTNGTKPEDVAQDVWDDWCGQWECVSDNKTGNSVENTSDVQGWIENLAGQTGFTGGSAHLVQAMLGQNANGIPKATFTFTGTGVDIYSFTNNTTGTVMVQVSDVKGIYPSSYYIVDTGANTAEGYYQVSTISFVGKGHSTYQVTIMVTTAAASENRFAFYLDGIRVYNPLEEDAKDEMVEDAYGDEMHAVFGSVRQMLLDAGSFTGETGEGTGFVFLDRLPDSENAGSTNVIGTYAVYGPKNEVYLAKGQAIAFKVDETLYSRVQVGLKSLTGEEVQAVVSYFDEESAAAAQGMVTISHTADLYYELMPMEGYVVIRNTSDAILAVTKVKLMASGDPQQISAQVEKVSQAEVLEAVEEFDALPMMTYRLRNFRPDVESAQPEVSVEDVAAAQMRALLEKLFGSMRKWLKED